MASSIIQESEYDFQDSEILSDEFQNMIGALEEPVFFESDGKYIGVYPEGYIYYGEMNDGIRSGSGYWYHGNKKSISVDHGTWENDRPNGTFVSEIYTNPNEIEREDGRVYALHVITSGTVIEGTYDGVAHVTWFMEDDDCNHEWDVTYVNGISQSIDSDRNGKIAAYCIKCGADLRCNSEKRKIYGITK